ncbi:hypothetical protein NFI96_002578 [Prochilodus magdalenae]|nr:hypothetical protein NFI96_002578 [Prochilodus magdalenae]
MPDFHSSMKERLRTPEQGADTVVWLAVSEAAVTRPSGRFFQGPPQDPHRAGTMWVVDHSQYCSDTDVVVVC